MKQADYNMNAQKLEVETQLAECVADVATMEAERVDDLGSAGLGDVRRERDAVRPKAVEDLHVPCQKPLLQRPILHAAEHPANERPVRQRHDRAPAPALAPEEDETERAGAEFEKTTEDSATVACFREFGVAEGDILRRPLGSSKIVILRADLPP